MELGDEFSLDVLKNALKTQRIEAKQREDALKDQLSTLCLVSLYFPLHSLRFQDVCI